MKANIKTVAKRAGVSIASVSRVLNKHKGVKDTTRKKVLKAMEDLDYEVNAVARSLKLRKTSIIGVIVANILSPFYSEIAKAIEEVANRFNYNVILCNSDENPEKELRHLKMLKSNRVDGIILTPTQENQNYLKKLINSDTELVIIDRLIDGIDCNGVIIDNEVGSYTAVKHLIDRGYKKIAIIDGPTEIFTAQERLSGYLRALKDASIPIDEDLIQIGTYKEESGIKLTKLLLDGPKKIDSIFITNLDMMLGALIVLKERGLKIPSDIGLIAFSNYRWSRITDPPLSVINFPIKEIGLLAINMLLDLLNNEEKKHPSVVKVKTNLVVRKST